MIATGLILLFLALGLAILGVIGIYEAWLDGKVACITIALAIIGIVLIVAGSICGGT